MDAHAPRLGEQTNGAKSIRCPIDHARRSIARMRVGANPVIHLRS